MGRQKLIILPRLHDYNGNIDKQWFIFFSYRDPMNGKMKRIRIYEGFAERRSAEEKRQYAYQLISRYKKKLMGGWDPFSDKHIIYEDALQYDSIENKSRLRQNKFNLEFYINRFMAVKKGSLRASSFHCYTSIFRVLRDWMITKKIADIDIEFFNSVHAEEFISTFAGRSPSTTNRFIVVIKSFFEYLVEKNEIKQNPFRLLKKRKESNRPPKFFPEEIRTAIKKESQKSDHIQLWLFQEFIYYTFIRPGELRGLKLADIDFSAEKITVRREIAKNNKEQKVILPDQLKQRLIKLKYHLSDKDLFVFSPQGIPAKDQVSKNFFNKQFQKIRKRLQLSTDYKLYGWKHTGAINLAKVANIKEVQLQLRHHSLDETDIYISQMKDQESETVKMKFPEA